MSPPEVQEELNQLLALPQERVPLDRAALLLAIDEYPHLEPEPYLDQMDDLARLVEVRNQGSEDAVCRIASLRRVLFEDAGFQGNRERYPDPRNSYLNEVLDRRLGIPITLSILVLGVTARLDWPFCGVSFPGHFLIRYGAAAPFLAVDPFHGGLILAEDELVERWAAATGCTAPPVAGMLCGASPGQILARLLRNLKLRYVEASDFRRAAIVAEKMILVEPEIAAYHRDLGYIYSVLKRPEMAVQELQSYLRLSPGAPDRDEVLARIQTVADSGLRRES